MMDIEEPVQQASICIHCCGPMHPSNSDNENNHRLQHSAPSLSNSAYYVTKALSSIFKLDFLKPFDTLGWNQGDEQLTLLCVGCRDVLADLYHLYQDFLQLGQLDSVLSKKLDRLDEIIDLHERKSINCDLIRIERSDGRQSKKDIPGKSTISNPTRSPSASRQLCSKEKNKLLTPLPENKSTSTNTTTTTTTEEEEELNVSPSDQELEGDDYNPDWLDVKLEEGDDDDDDDVQILTPEVKPSEDIIIESESESDDDEKRLRTYAMHFEGIAVEYYGRKRRKQDMIGSSKIIQSTSSLSSSTATSCSNSNTSNIYQKDEVNHKNSSNNIFLDEKRKYQYLRLKGKFPNPCWYCERTDFSTPADLFEHTMKEHFSKINNNSATSSIPVCTRCSKISFKQITLDDHLKWCETIPSGVVAKLFQCTVCSKSFSTKEYLKTHMTVHTDDRPFPCDQCEFRARKSTILINHKKYRHSTSDQVVKCDECGVNYRNDFVLRNHKQRMHTVEGYQKYREREKIRAAKMKGEKRANTGQVSTVCTDCGVDLLHRLALINHRQTVHGDVMGRKFTCDACGTCLTSKHSLDDHVKTVHSDDRPYICETCGKSFKRLYTLKSHVKVTHTEEGRLKYNESTREKNRRRKLRESLLASTAGGGQSGQPGDESSNSNND